VSETEFGAFRVITKLDRDEAVDLFPVRIVIPFPGLDKFFAGTNFAVAERGHLLAVGRAQFPPPFPADPRVEFPRETLDSFSGPTIVSFARDRSRRRKRNRVAP
jgi:hypothetical protein